MKKVAVVFTLLLLASSLVAFGQEKRLSKKKVSLPILNHLKTNYPDASKLKFYKEKTGENTFIESEFWDKGKKYALKFLKDSLVEVEIFLEFKEIPTPIQKAILSTLDSSFTHYKILESQEVNPATEQALYEIYVKSKKGKSKGYFELFFDKAGKLVHTIEIIAKPIPSQF
jgi:hypothetical protein